MKLVIMGAGAIGAFMGGRLTEAGEDVVLVARGSHLKAMQERGLRISDDRGERVVRPSCTDDLAVLDKADAVFITLKAHNLPALAPRLAASLGRQAAVISAQNGIPWWYFQRLPGELEGIWLDSVDPQGVVAGSIDPQRVIGCVVYPAAVLEEPGAVRLVEGDRFSLGEIDGTESERCRALSRALIGAGFRAPVVSNIRDEIWVKLLGNAVFNPISALTRATLSEIAESPITAGLVREAMEEVIEVAGRVGVNIPVTIDRRIRGAARVGAHRTSMLQDLESGRPLEIDPLLGAVVELAHRLQVDVPRLRTLYSCVKLLEAHAGSQRA